MELLTRGQYALRAESSDSQMLVAMPISTTHSETFHHPIIQIVEIDDANKRCRWMLRSGTDISRFSLSATLGFLALEYAFEKLQMRKVHVELCADEIQLLEIHRKLGFCEEGRLVRHIVKSDKAWDVILLAHFKESWEKKRRNLESLVTDGGSFQ
jgi:hypothetical protein